MALNGRGEDTRGVLSSSAACAASSSLGNAIPVARVHAMHEACEEEGAGGSRHILVNYDRKSSVFITGLSLGPRGSGAVNTVAARGNPLFERPTL